MAVLVVAAVGGAYLYQGSGKAGEVGSQAPGPGARPSGAGGPGAGGPAGGRGFAQPMTVELAAASRADLADRVTVVGNLIGSVTVEVVPKVSGRLQDVFVRLGDRVGRGQRMAKVEDGELREQVKQAEASYGVAQATIRQREADLKFAKTSAERSHSLFERQLLPRQAMDDAEARDQAATAQLDLARSQFDQAKARLEELRIMTANTLIVSPVDGFVGKRSLDPGAWVTPNSPFISVVDIHIVRLVVNVIEKDLRRIAVGTVAEVEVDAYPGEVFSGRVARIAPVIDPATRTAQIEVETPNGDFRLKPGMYARARFTVEQHRQALAVPTAAVVDLNGKRGVFRSPDGKTANFHPVLTGLEEQGLIEITEGLQEGEQIITTGAAGLRDGDRILLAKQDGGAGGQGRTGGGPPSARAEGGEPSGRTPVPPSAPSISR